VRSAATRRWIACAPRRKTADAELINAVARYCKIQYFVRRSEIIRTGTHGRQNSRLESGDRDPHRQYDRALVGAAIMNGSIGPKVYRRPQLLPPTPATSPSIRATPRPAVPVGDHLYRWRQGLSCSIAATRSRSSPRTAISARFPNLLLFASCRPPSRRRSCLDITHHTMVHGRSARSSAAFRRDRTRWRSCAASSARCRRLP